MAEVHTRYVSAYVTETAKARGPLKGLRDELRGGAVDADKMERELAQLGQQGQETGRKLGGAGNRSRDVARKFLKLTQQFDRQEKKLRRLNRKLSELAEKLKKAERRGDSAGGSFGKFGRSLSSARTKLLGAIGAVAGLTAGVHLLGAQITDSIKLYGIQEEADRRLASQIAATGAAAGLTAEQLQEQAAALQLVTGIGNEATQAQQAFLLSFKGIGAEVFGRTIELAEDMKKVLPAGGEALTQLAKALDQLAAGSVAGVTALRRSGTILTDAQTKQLESLAVTGRALEAQKLLLSEVESQYGGVARQLRDTLPGASRAWASELGDLKEEVGELVAGTGGMRDMVEAGVDVTRMFADLIATANETKTTVPAIRRELSILARALSPEFVTAAQNAQIALSALQEFARNREDNEKLADLYKRSAINAGLLAKELDVAPHERYSAATAETVSWLERLDRQSERVIEEFKAIEKAENDAAKAAEDLSKFLATVSSETFIAEAQAKRWAAALGDEAAPTLILLKETAFNVVTGIEELTHTFSELSEEISRIPGLDDLEASVGRLARLPLDHLTPSRTQDLPSGTIRILTQPEIDARFEANLSEAMSRALSLAAKSQVAGDAFGALFSGESVAEGFRSASGDFVGALTPAFAGLSDDLRENLQEGGANIVDGVGAALTAVASLLQSAGALGSSGQAALGGAAIGSQIGAAAEDWLDTIKGADIWGAIIGAIIGLVVDMMATVTETFANASTQVGRLKSDFVVTNNELGEATEAVLFGAIDTVNRILDQVGGTLDSFETFGVQIRETDDGRIKVWVNDVLHWADSVQDAVGIISSLILRNADISGISDVVQAAISSSTRESLEELQRNINLALQIELFDLPAVQQAIHSRVQAFNEIAIRALRDLGGAGLEETLSGPSGLLGFLAAEVDAFLGRQPELEEAVKGRQAALEAEILIAKANLLVLRAQVDGEVAALGQRADIHRTNMKITEAELRAMLLEAQGRAGVTESTLLHASAMFDAVAVIDAALASLDDLLADVRGGLGEAMEAARRAAGAAGQAQRRQAQETRQNALRELELLEARASGNDSLARELEARHALEDAIAQSVEGLTAEEAAEAERLLTLLAEEEAVRETTRRIRELVDAAQSASDTIQGTFDAILELAEGPSGAPSRAASFEDLRDQLTEQIEDLQQQIARAYEDGNDELGATLEATLADIFRRWQETMASEGEIMRRAGQEALAGLGDSAAALALEAEASAAAIQYLLDHLDELGITAADVAAAVREGVLPGLLAQAEAEARRVGDLDRANALLQRRERLERDLALLQLANVEAQLFAAGAMTIELAKIIGGLRRDLGTETPDGTEPEPEVEARDVLDIAQALGASAARWIADARDMREALGELVGGVEAGSISIEAAAAVWANAGDNAFRSLAGDLLGFVDRYYGETAEAEELRLAHLQISHALEVAEFEIRIQLARSLGVLTARQLAAVEDLLGFVRSHEPDWDVLVNGVDTAGGSARTTGQAAQQLADQLTALRDELASLLDAAEDANLGPIQRQLNSIYDTFARIGSLLLTTSATEEDWQRARIAMVDQLAAAWAGAFQPAEDLLGEIQTSRQSPTERFLEAQSEFRALELPADLSGLNPDEITDLVATARRFRELGVAQFGEGFNASRQSREIEDFLEQLVGLAPTEEDLLLLAIQHLEEQTAIRLDTVATHTGSRGAIVAAIEDITPEEGLAAELREIAAQLGDTGLAGILNGIADELIAGTLDVNDGALLLGLDGVRDQLAPGSPMLGRLETIIDRVTEAMVGDASTLGAGLLDIAAGLGADSPLGAELAAIAAQLLDGTLSIDSGELILALDQIADGLGPDHPLHDILTGLQSTLISSLGERGTLGELLAIVAGTLDGAVAEELAAIAAQLLSGTLTIDSPDLVLGLDAVIDQLGPGHPLHDILKNTRGELIRGLGSRGALSELLGTVAGTLDGAVSDELAAIAQQLLTGELSIDDARLFERLSAVRDQLGPNHPLHDVIGDVLDGLDPLDPIEGSLMEGGHGTGHWAERTANRLIWGGKTAAQLLNQVDGSLGTIENRLFSGGRSAASWLQSIHGLMGGGSNFNRGTATPVLDLLPLTSRVDTTNDRLAKIEAHLAAIASSGPIVVAGY